MFSAAGAAAQGKRWKFPLGKLWGPLMASFLQEFDPQRAVAVRVYGQFSLSLLPSTCPILRELQSFRAVLSQESSWMVGGRGTQYG